MLLPRQCSEKKIKAVDSLCQALRPLQTGCHCRGNIPPPPQKKNLRDTYWFPEADFTSASNVPFARKRITDSAQHTILYWCFPTYLIVHLRSLHPWGIDKYNRLSAWGHPCTISPGIWDCEVPRNSEFQCFRNSVSSSVSNLVFSVPCPLGGLFIFSIRCDSYDPVEYGYSTTCEKLEQSGKWSLVLREKRELHTNPNEERLRYCYLITYKILQWKLKTRTVHYLPKVTLISIRNFRPRRIFLLVNSKQPGTPFVKEE